LHSFIMLLNKESNINDIDGIIAEKVDLLFEKRKAVRENALKSLHATLALRYCGEALESRHETLAEGLERVLKDQQLEPTLYALRTSSVAAISLPSGHFAFFMKLSDVLQRLLADENVPVALRIEAIHALSVTCFMSTTFDVNHDLARTVSTLTLLLDFVFVKPTPPDLSRAALQGCMLVASTLLGHTRHEEVFEKYFSKVVDLMDEKHEIGLRVSGAKAATVLVEWEKEYMKVDGVAEIEQDLGNVLDKMLGVLDDKAKFKNRVERKRQRNELKALILYLEGGPVEEESIVIRTHALWLDTWTQIFRMDRFRTLLGEGFMTHLEENKNLMYIFDYYIDIKAPILPTMSKQQRRMSLSEASKVATKARFGLRAIREQEMGYATE